MTGVFLIFSLTSKGSETIHGRLVKPKIRIDVIKALKRRIIFLIIRFPPKKLLLYFIIFLFSIKKSLKKVKKLLV